MRRLALAIAAAAGLMAANVPNERVDAMPLGDPSGVREAAARLNVIDNAQYVWGGRRYCWYDAGWQGSGWYWCGYAWRRGLGWGGPVGWRGWVWRGGGGGYGYGRVGRTGYVGRTGRVGTTGRVGRTGATGRTGRVGRTGATGRTGARGGRTGARGGRTGARGGRTGGGRTGGGGRGGSRRSDIQLKHDIALLGHLDNGVGFYRFSYDGERRAYVGVLAQDVQAVRPDAVVRGRDGYLRVYYDTLGIRFQSYDDWLAAGGRVPRGRPLSH